MRTQINVAFGFLSNIPPDQRARCLASAYVQNPCRRIYAVDPSRRFQYETPRVNGQRGTTNVQWLGEHPHNWAEEARAKALQIPALRARGEPIHRGIVVKAPTTTLTFKRLAAGEGTMILDFEARFLDQMEEIYAAIVESTNNRQVNELLRRKTQIRRDFAKRLVTLGYPQLIGSRTKSLDFKNDLKRPVYPAWFVEGVPSKKGRPIAEEWMLSRKLQWGGRTKSLRYEVENALVLGETVPRFGFEIELTTLHRIDYINQTPRSQLTDNVVGHI